MSWTVEQQAALEKGCVIPAYFAELQFATATQRLCTFSQTMSWGGYDWIGLGQFGGIDALEESEGVQSRALNFMLTLDADMLPLAIGPVEEYRGLPAKLYSCPLDENFQLIGTPQIRWRGKMDMMSLGINGDEGKIILKCETTVFGLKRPDTLRMNAAQQKARYPNDTSFIYLNDLIATPLTWVTKRFQEI